MADGVFVRLEGVDELKAALKDVGTQIRKKAVRNALREAGKVIQAAAKVAAPVLAAPTMTRTPGTLQKNIAVRGSKFARQVGNEGVYVSVRPLSGKRQDRLGKAGARNPNDPFYWRFVEFGTRKMSARPFMRTAAAQKGPQAIDAFMKSVVPQIQKLNAKASRGR